MLVHAVLVDSGPDGTDPVRMLQIIGGHYRSRRLLTPPDAATTRPYAHRVKESVFNILRGHVEDARVLDLFAGVGTMGLEAISRGAAEVLMVEQDARIFDLLKKNIQALGCEDRADALRGDALGSVSLLRSPRPLDIAFVDPPFVMMRDEGTRSRVMSHISRLSEYLADDGLVVLRTPLDAHRVQHEVDGMDGPEIREQGRHNQVLLYARSGQTS